MEKINDLKTNRLSRHRDSLCNESESGLLRIAITPITSFKFYTTIISFVVAIALSVSPAYGKTKRKAKFRSTYEVTSAAPSVREISIQLYGTTQKWKNIVRWNRLRAPYRVYSGQKLTLKLRPTHKPASGNKLILSMWRKYFGIDQAMPQTKVPTRALSSTNSFPATTPVSASDADLAPISVPAPTPVPVPVPSPTPIPVPKVLPPTITAAEFTKNDIEKISTKEASKEMSAETLFSEGKKAFEEKDFKNAQKFFAKSRALNPENLPSWFSEIQANLALGDRPAAQAIALKFVQLRPNLKELPLLKSLTDTSSVPATANEEGR